MNSPFNPYLKWLGIPLKDQPPNHYRLLGVELYEVDADIIERAADRHMSYLRSLQTGEHGDAAQQLLNEISAARVCLLDSAKRTPYDEALQVRLQEAELRPSESPRIEKPAVRQADILAGAKPAASKVPPERGKPSAGLKSAQPKANSSSAVVPAVAIAAASVSTNGNTGRPSPTPRTQNSNADGSMVPLLLGIAGGGAALLLLAVITAFALLARVDEPTRVADSSSVSVETGGGNDITRPNASTEQGRNETNNGTNVETNIDGSQDNTEGHSTPSTIDNDSEASQTGNETNNSQNKGRIKSKHSHLLVQAPFLKGNLVVGSKPLSDRDYFFSKVDSPLRGLEFTQWPYGPVKPFEFSIERSGAIYLILPPDQYARPLPNINISSWKKTQLKCNIRVANGRTLPCKVYRHEGQSGVARIASGPALWPILAAGKLDKKVRLLGDIVKGDTETNNPGSTGTDTTNSGEVNNTDTDTDTEPETPIAPVSIVKAPVPTNAAQGLIKERVSEVFELSSLSTTEEKVATAKRLLDAGREPTVDTVERYVMLSTAARVAGEAGDLVTALQAVDEIDKSYKADTPPMRLYLVSKFTKARIPKKLKVAQLEYAVKALDNGLANDEFAAVDEAVTDLFSAGLVHKELANRRKIAREMKGKYRKVAAAKETLKSNPDDGEANRIVGEYISFHKLNWDDGLSLLAKCDDAKLSQLAKSDLSNPKEAADQVRIADGWFDVAQAQEASLAKGALLTRAEDWYRKAIGELKGLNEAHAKKRLDEIKATLVDAGWVDVPREATIAARSGYQCEIYLNGKQIISSHSVGIANATLRRGDLLLVRARRSNSTSNISSSSKGFACVIAYEDSTAPVVTGYSKGWQAFVPSNTISWYKPERVVRTLRCITSPGQGHIDLNQKTGVQARSIWSAADASIGYFFYRVP